jgi:hypothetical protein
VHFFTTVVPDVFEKMNTRTKIDYENAIKEGSEKLAYARVMFLGKDRSGKSSVLGGLMGKTWDKDKESTPLAETRSCTYKWMGGNMVEGDRVEDVWKEWSEEDEQLELAHLARKVLENPQSSKKKEPEMSSARDGEVLHQPSESSKVVSSESSERPISKEKEVTSDVKQDAEGSSHQHKEGASIIASSSTAISDLQQPRLSYMDVKNFLDECIQNVSEKAETLERHTRCHYVLHVWDCGGQPVFLDIISAFLTFRTFFVLVFNAKVGLQELCGTGSISYKGEPVPAGEHQSTNIKLLIRWMRLIYTHLNDRIPKIIPVGTHGDMVEDEESVKDSFDSECKNEYFCNILLETLIIDNTKAGKKEEDIGYKYIRKSVCEFAENPKIKTPLPWLLFRMVVNKLGNKHTRHTLSYEEADQIARACHIPRVNSVLDFYHNLGVFLYYPDIDRKTIYIDPQWLFKQFSGLLMANYHRDLQISIGAKNNLSRYGILTSEIYNKVLRDCGVAPDVLLGILDKFDIAKKIKQAPKCMKHDEDDKYFMPCMLSLRDQGGSGPTEVQNPIQAATLHVVFPEMSFVPPGFFVRLVARIASNEQDFKLHFVSIWRDFISFQYDQYNEVNICEPSSLHSVHVDVTRHRDWANRTPSFKESCQTLRDKLYGICEDVLRWLPTEFEFAFRCKHCKNEENFVSLHLQNNECNFSTAMCEGCRNPLVITQEHKFWDSSPQESDIAFSESDGGASNAEVQTPMVVDGPGQASQSATTRMYETGEFVKRKGDCSTDLQQAGLNKTIESRELAIIARDRLTNWETLRPFLGLKRQQNKSITESHPKDYEKQKLECLEVWQEAVGDKATYGALIKAAEDARLHDLADGVRKLCKELQLHHTVKE